MVAGTSRDKFHGRSHKVLIHTAAAIVNSRTGEIAAINVTADEKVMNGEKVDINLVNAIAFDPYTHGYYKVGEKVGEAFKDGFKIK